MFRFKMNSDSIQFWIMAAAFIALAGSFTQWASEHFATAEQVSVISKRVDTEVEERRELKSEVDGLYLHLVPQSQQLPIRHPGSVRNAR